MEFINHVSLLYICGKMVKNCKILDDTKFIQTPIINFETLPLAIGDFVFEGIWKAQKLSKEID